MAGSDRYSTTPPPPPQNTRHQQINPSHGLNHQTPLSCPQLDHEDLEQLDKFDLEEIDVKSSGGHDFHENEEKQGILLENADPRGIKIVGGEMLGTLGTNDKDNGRKIGKLEETRSLVSLNGEVLMDQSRIR
ncbi:hypothetical protein Tco_1321150 [Tanacetum coccineum]